MNAHLTDLLDLYLDGELPPARARQVEAHLAACAECRAHLDRRRALSALLAEAPAIQPQISDQHFVASLGLQMERREPPARRSGGAGGLAWWLAPVGLLLAGAFLAVTLLLSTFISYLPGAEQALTGAAGSWNSLIGGLVPAGPAAAPIQLAAWVQLPQFGPLTLVLLLLALAVLYLGWLASALTRAAQANPRSFNE